MVHLGGTTGRVPQAVPTRVFAEFCQNLAYLRLDPAQRLGDGAVKPVVAYVPGDRVLGLSKIPRIVDMFAHRLQIQERLANEIADALDEVLDPSGVMILVEGEHSCARLRGIKKHGVNMVTTAQRGVFKQDRELRNEFYRLIGR
jgi:GTP cyclohydrolase I